MIFNFLLSLGLSCAVGGVLIENSNSSHIISDDNFHSTINNKVDTSESESSSEISYPIYDDVSYTITLSAYQLNNYTWDNLLNYLFTDNLFQNRNVVPSFTYNGNVFSNTTGNNPSAYAYLTFSNASASLEDYYFSLNKSAVGATDSQDSKFRYENLTSNPFNQPFETNGMLTIGSSYYVDFKTAIQADIQANEQSGNMSTLQDILSDIVSLLTSGIVGMGTGLANGINTTITSLVVDNGAMSIFLGVVAIFGGIALAVGITRRIFSWIESLGAKG